MDKCIMILPGTPLSVINNILGLSNNNAAKKINDCIKEVIDTLNKKGFDQSSRYSNLLKKIPDGKIREGHIKVINKLIDELGRVHIKSESKIKAREMVEKKIELSLS